MKWKEKLRRRDQMPINNSEKQFESDIEFDLLNQGYRQMKPT